MSEIVRYEKEGYIGKIILNNPDKNNALDLLTVKKLIEAFETSSQNDDICVIYSAVGKNFTVGADLKYGFNLISKPEKLQEAIEFLESFQDLTRAMLAHNGIIIAGIHGWVIGGGFEQLLCCDLRIAAEDTRIMMPELGVGLFFSNASTKLLPRIIGEGRAKHLMYLGTEINADEAFNIGLVSQVCKREGLRRNLKRIANSLIQKEHSVLKSAKKLINEDQDENFESVLAKELRVMMLAGQSEELKRKLEKFVKR